MLHPLGKMVSIAYGFIDHRGLLGSLTDNVDEINYFFLKFLDVLDHDRSFGLPNIFVCFALGGKGADNPYYCNDVTAVE